MVRAKVVQMVKGLYAKNAIIQAIKHLIAQIKPPMQMLRQQNSNSNSNSNNSNSNKQTSGIIRHPCRLDFQP